MGLLPTIGEFLIINERTIRVVCQVFQTSVSCNGSPGPPGARPASFRLVPVQLDAREFPSLTATHENQEREKSFATAGAAFSRNRVQGASKNR